MYQIIYKKKKKIVQVHTNEELNFFIILFKVLTLKVKFKHLAFL